MFGDTSGWQSDRSELLLPCGRMYATKGPQRLRLKHCMSVDELIHSWEAAGEEGRRRWLLVS